MKTISENTAFGGLQFVCTHDSAATGCTMTFGIFLPPQAAAGPVPVLWYLSGLTCTHENAMTKAGAQGWAAEQGLALIFPDTSPRGEGIADDEGYDLGQGAGFYVDATEPPWAPNYAMYTYVTMELPALVIDQFPIDPNRQGITGHSMGGHGALTIALRNPEVYRSVSAFAPICNPTGSDWGRKQLTAYLGTDEERWVHHDATQLMRSQGWGEDILIDQGASDQFLDLLRPEALVGAIAETRTAATVRLQPGYDHSYYFVASFMQDHIRWHAERL